MIIAFWFLSLVLLGVVLGFLAWALVKDRRYSEGGRTLFNGFRSALKGYGFTNRRYPVELWKWETMQDEDVCDDCLERAEWPPMDIADWMKEGLPGTPEAETECGEHCRCRLVRHRSTPFFKKHGKTL
jgi:hypothetical protein